MEHYVMYVKTVYLINGVGEVGQVHAKNETGPLSYTIYNAPTNGLKTQI